MPIANLPPFYNAENYVTKEGKLTPQSSMYHDQNFQSLNAQIILSNGIASTTVDKGGVTINGINPPSLTTDKITATAPSVPIGTIWYNSTLDKLQFKGKTAIQTITST